MEFNEQVISYKGRVVFIRLTMPFFNRTLKEYVANEACFMFVNKGNVGVRSSSSYLNLNKTTAMLAKCLNYFFEPIGTQKENPEGIESIGIFLYPEMLQEIFEFDSLSTNYKLSNIQQVEVNLLLENYKNSISIFLDNPELADENLIKTKIKEFVLLMTKMQNAPSQLDFIAALFQTDAIAFKNTIQQNLYAKLSLDELALLCHLSLSSFKRKFKETFNESPKKYLNRKKIEKAAELLKHSNQRISAIAYDVGFDSVTTFNRNFTSYYGKSPSNFRLG